MGIINEFIGQYGMTIIYTILTAIAGAVATLIKKKYDEWANGKIKKETVQTVVYAVQQLYTDLDGSEKKEKAVEGIVAMLSEKGITVTELEIDMLIESCVAEAKNVFNKAT